MNDITVPMAIVDFIPVALFFAAAVILQRDLYNKIDKGPFALLSAGSILVLLGGIYKAAWKILYALGACDFQALNAAFFPLQGPGFLLVFLALIGLLTRLHRRKQDTALLSAAALPAVYDSNLVFIVCQTIGCGGMQWVLFALSLRMKKTWAAVLFVVSFVFMLGMGYLGAKFDDTSAMHWLAQGTNVISQSALLGGVLVLHTAGLAGENSLNKA